MMKPFLHVGRTSGGVTTLGPGRRYGIWLEGCRRACPGCLATDLWEQRAESRVPVADFWAVVAPRLPGHTGVTISGGEPFLQAAGLLALLRRLAALPDLDVMVYSGYHLSELRDGAPEVREALGLIDLLVDGPYREDLPNTLLWRGSDNQRLRLLTPRARRYRRFVNARYGPRRRLQFAAGADGGLHFVGIPERDFVHGLFAGLRARGIRLEERS